MAYILLVDDSQAMLHEITDMLAFEDHMLIAYSDSDHALADLTMWDADPQKLPDLIMLAILPAYLHGYDLAFKLRQLPYASRLPLMLVTPQPDHEIEDEIATLFDAYLRIPFRANELIAVVDKLLDG